MMIDEFKLGTTGYTDFHKLTRIYNDNVETQDFASPG